jgi:hypothetical protein
VKGAACGPRRRLAGINYSKKTITPEFFYGESLDSTSQDFARPPDGKSLLNQRPTLAAPRAAPLESLSGPNSESNDLQSPGKSKGSGRKLRTDPLNQFVSIKKCSLQSAVQKIASPFPNIAHHYWDNMRFTGERQVRPARAPRF